ncbi:MAG: hypothetical protein R6V85_11300 [Polyangia bacterium]
MNAHLSAKTTILIAAALALCCTARGVRPGDRAEPGQTVAFARASVEGMRASKLLICEAERVAAGRAVPVAEVALKSGTGTYATFLEPGRYAVPGVMRAEQLDRPLEAERGTLVFDLEAGASNYIGSYWPLTESGRQIAVDLGGGKAFYAARAAFEKRFFGLARRFPVRDALKTAELLTIQQAEDDSR